MKNKPLYPAIIIEGDYIGRVGNATHPNEFGNVMFYPIEGKNPYRICKIASEVRFTGTEGE